MHAACVLQEGMLDAAIEDYSLAIQLNPQHCRAFYNRAFCHDRLNHVEDAIADYTRALDLEPHNATAHHNRGSLHERVGRWVGGWHTTTGAACMSGSAGGWASGTP